MVSGSVCAKVVLIKVFLHTPDNDRKLVPHEFSQSPLLLLYEFYEIFCAHLFFKINSIFASVRINTSVLTSKVSGGFSGAPDFFYSM